MDLVFILSFVGRKSYSLIGLEGYKLRGSKVQRFKGSEVSIAIRRFESNTLSFYEDKA